MEQQVQQIPREDKLKVFNKVIWIAIPMVAMLILGIVLGISIQGHKIETILKDKTFTPCVDPEGNILIRQNTSLLNMSGQPTDYSTR